MSLEPWGEEREARAEADQQSNSSNQFYFFFFFVVPNHAREREGPDFKNSCLAAATAVAHTLQKAAAAAVTGSPPFVSVNAPVAPGLVPSFIMKW